MSSKFPLLKVTNLVFEEIVNQMELNEIFSLSLCSRYTCDVVKCHLRNSIKYPLYVDAKLENVLSVGFISNDGPVVIMSIEDFDRWDGTRLEEVNIGGCKTRIAKNGNHCVMFQSSIDKMGLNEFAANGNTGGLQFETKFRNKYVLHLFRGRLEYVRFKQGGFVPFDALMQIARSNKEAIFDKIFLTNEEVSKLYISWFSGFFTNGLKMLLVRVDDYNEGETLSRVRHLVVNRDQPTIFKSFSGKVQRFNPGLGLRRSDGTVACIDYNRFTRTLRFCSVTGSAIN